MQLNEIKKGFWGYQKESVYHYVVALEGELTTQFEKRNEESERQLNEARERIAELEQKLKEEQEKNQVLMKHRLNIADAMIEAQSYAAQIKEESDQYQEDTRKYLEELVTRKKDELNVYDRQIKKLRNEFYQTIQEMDQKAEDLEKSLLEMEERIPVVNLSMFTKKEEVNGDL